MGVRVGGGGRMRHPKSTTCGVVVVKTMSFGADLFIYFTFRYIFLRVCMLNGKLYLIFLSSNGKRHAKDVGETTQNA